MRPTTKDLAKAAGVSLATVDRVLNDRPGVRGKTVERVNRAIAEIGFVRNLSAANLARRREYRFAFVLPRAGDQFLAEIRARIAEAGEAFAADMIHSRVIAVDETDPRGIVAVLNDLDAQVCDGVAIMAPQTPQLRDALRRLQQRGVHVISFVSDPSGGTDAMDFVGIDNRAAGATAGQLIGRFAGARKGRVLVVAETLQARDSLHRRLGFDAVLRRGFPDLQALPTLETHGDAVRARRVIARVLETVPDIVAAYVLSSEARDPLEAICAGPAPRDMVRVLHERTPFTETALLDGTADAVIAQNPGHLVRSALRILRARCDGRSTLASQEKIRIEILIRENL